MINEYATRAAMNEARAVDGWLRSYGFNERNIADSGVTLQQATAHGETGDITRTYWLMRQGRALASMRFVHRLEVQR